jgi:hypothetical protein
MRGETPKSKLKGVSKQMEKSMSEKQLSGQRTSWPSRSATLN